MGSRHKDTLLLVGDNDSDRRNLRSIFAPKYYILEAENAAQGIMLLEQNGKFIAAVLADIPLGRGEELTALVEAGRKDPVHEIPVIALVTLKGMGENEEYAFILGAADVVRKPYTTLSIQRRVQVLVELHMQQWNLEQQVRQQEETIRSNHQTMLDTLSSIIEYRSSESGKHVLRIRRFTKVLLEEVRRSYPEYGLDSSTIDIITSAAALHDIGKISIPDYILHNTGPLNPEEYEIMKTHTTTGGELARGLGPMEDIRLLRYIYNIALYHHERWDGSGYPEGLSGDQIPLCAQVVGIADAFDALTSQRAYKNPFPCEDAVNMIIHGECGVFSPKMLECLKRTKEQLIADARLYADGYSPKSDNIHMTLPGPTPQQHAMNAQEMSQIKYNSLLHHLNDTVIEMDLDARIYHVVYNPNPDFATLFQDVGYDRLSDQIMRRMVPPEETQQVAASYGEGMLRLLRQGALTYRFHCRMYSPSRDDYVPYEVTLQRLLTENQDQHMILAIFHRLEEGQAPAAPQHGSLLQNAAMYDLASADLCCLNDPAVTIREGAGNLTPLTGFSLQEVWSRFRNSLAEMALPQDRERLLRAMDPRSIREGRGESVFRLQRREGAPVWVQCRSRYSVGADGAEYRYCVLTDVHRLQEEILHLRGDLDRSRILWELPRIIRFEWDLATDRIDYSHQWKERFGYDAPGQGFSQRFQLANHCHPDDLDLLRSKFEWLAQGKQTDMADVRIANSEGRYFWVRIRGTTLFDEQGRPASVIGIIDDIDQLKVDALSLQRQALHDALTGLLNKASAQQAVSEYLAHRGKDTLAAMLVLDLDNFKTINDTQGHFYGDAVLQQVGDTLRSLFRVQDMVGRIGGDEFMVLLKDMPDEESIRDRCALVVDTLRTQLQRLVPDLPVSVTVGAAIAPRDGSSFADLFCHADEALYAAKRKGKNRYGIYSLQDKLDMLTEAGPHTTRIDSDFRDAITDEKMIRFVFQSLYESRNLEATIQELLAYIGIHFNVSRVYIFENNEDNTTCSNTFEWCSGGIEPQIQNLQNVSYETDIPGWPQVYDENGVLYCTDVSQLSDLVRAVVEPQGIKSMLHCAIMDQGVFRGYVGFDECSDNHLWTQGQVDLLKRLASVFSVFVTRLRSSQKKQT